MTMHSNAISIILTWFALCLLHRNFDTRVGVSVESKSSLSSEEKSESSDESNSMAWVSSFIARMYS